MLSVKPFSGKHAFGKTPGASKEAVDISARFGRPGNDSVEQLPRQDPAHQHHTLFQQAAGLIAFRVQPLGNDNLGAKKLHKAAEIPGAAVVTGENIHVNTLMDLRIPGMVFFQACGAVQAQLGKEHGPVF